MNKKITLHEIQHLRNTFFQKIRSSILYYFRMRSTYHTQGIRSATTKRRKREVRGEYFWWEWFLIYFFFATAGTGPRQEWVYRGTRSQFFYKYFYIDLYPRNSLKTLTFHEANYNQRRLKCSPNSLLNDFPTCGKPSTKTSAATLRDRKQNYRLKSQHTRDNCLLSPLGIPTQHGPP